MFPVGQGGGIIVQSGSCLAMTLGDGAQVKFTNSILDFPDTDCWAKSQFNKWPSSCSLVKVAVIAARISYCNIQREWLKTKRMLRNDAVM